MEAIDTLPKTIRIHFTNVMGAGAIQLLESLLPALVASKKVKIAKVYLPEGGVLSKFSAFSSSTTVLKYKRYLPNAISRFLECTFLSRKFNEPSPLLVLGDLPLRISSPQILFVQNSHLIKLSRINWHPGALKFAIARFIFRFNIKRVSAFVVQTDTMRDELATSYPSISNRIHVIRHPVPQWVLTNNVKWQNLDRELKRNLRLFYPAAGYPHKNHNLLSKIDASNSEDWSIERFTLTIDQASNPAPQISWVDCVGFLSPAEMINTYKGADALVFLSKKESLGFPLLEAMHLGMPIVCPDLPYARALCGDHAIYFDPNSVESLRLALIKLKRLFAENWSPDWSGQLSEIPKTWESFSSKLLNVVTKASSSHLN